jgi:hypothetical protein
VGAGVSAANIHGRTIEWIRERCEIDVNGCWIWQGGIQSSGYPSCGIPGNGKRSQSVHRLALSIKLGRVPSGLALHSCDVKRCCNPDHLRDGSAADNSRDARERGRLATGERNGNAKITSQMADDIRLLLRRDVPVAVIARVAGVHRAVVADIKKGRTWPAKGEGMRCGT